MIATLPFLEERFDYFNRKIFSGKLPPVSIKLGKATGSLGSCAYKKRRRFFGKVVCYDFRIRISTAFDLPENELEDVLLHEMIHYEILVGQIRDSSSHGRVFRSRMKEINEIYGRGIRISHRMSSIRQEPAR